MKISKRTFLVALAVAALAFAAVATRPAVADLTLWYLDGTTLKPVDNTWTVETGAGAGAPSDATYITQTADSDLSAEQALSSLSTGIMRVANTTGVITSLTNSSGIFTNISDETGGTGVLVGSVSPAFTGTPTFEGFISTASSTILSLMATNATTTNLYVTGLTSAVPIFDANGQATEASAQTCTNQFFRALSAAYVATCATVDISGDTNLTAGDGLTLTDDDIDFDGGASPGGSLGGTWASPTIDDLFLLNTGDSGTGTFDFGGAVLEIPNGTGPTADDVGELAHDTSDNMLILDDFVVGKATVKIWGATIASTSPAFIGGTNLAVPTELDGYTMTAIRCKVDSGTSKAIQITDGTNATESITCATTVTSDDGTITNAAVTAAEEMYIDFGSTSGTVDTVSITVFGQWTRE